MKTVRNYYARAIEKSQILSRFIVKKIIPTRNAFTVESQIFCASGAIFFVYALILCFALFYGWDSGRAYQLVDPNISDNINLSDLITVGRISFVHKKSDHEDQDKFAISVDRILSGRTLISMLVWVELGKGKSVESLGITKGQYGVFFLKRTDGGHYDLASKQYSILVDVPGATASAAVASDPETALAVELVHTLGASDVAFVDAAVGDHGYLADDLVGGLAKNTRDFETTAALMSMSYASVREPLEHLILTSSNTLARLRAFNILLGHDDFTYLGLLAPFLVNKSDPNMEVAARDIGSTLFAHARRKQVTEELGSVFVDLLHSPVASVRLGATAGLRNIGTRAAVDSLNATLQDADPDVRSQAALGLCEITRYKASVCHTPFKGHEAEYVDFWGKWVRSTPR